MRLVGFPRLSDGGKEVFLDGQAYRARDLRSAGLPSFAVTSKARSWCVFEYGVRTDQLSLTMAAILQGFRPDYPWHGSRTSAFEQLANAVPPPMGAALIDFITEGATQP